MLQGLRILLAEDNPTNQMVATQMLESLGATVVLAPDGARALDQLHGSTFDAALIDVEMPCVSGIEVIRRIRAAPPPLGLMPMIALTAYVMQEHREALLEAGVDGVIAKPILSIDRFGAQILDHVRSRTGNGAASLPALSSHVLDTLRHSLGRQALGTVLRTAREDLQQASRALTADCNLGKTEAMAATSHQLLGIAGSIGAEQLRIFLERHISAGDLRHPLRYGPAVDRLVSEIGRVLEAMNNELVD